MIRKEFLIFVGLVAVFSLASVSRTEAAAGTLDHASSTPDTPYGGKVSAYDIRFLVASSTPMESRVRLIFPAGFSVPSSVATSSISASVSAAGVVASSSAVAASGQELDLWLADGASVAAGEEIDLLDVPIIVNPYAGGTFQVGIQTRGLADDLFEEASSTAFVIYGSESEAGQTTDIKPPASSITLPINGQVIPAAKKYVIMGTGKDNEGSTVVNVEVSVDGGTTWYNAQVNSAGGTYNWEYAWDNPTGGEYTIQVRATDVKGNRETPGAGVKVSVPGAVVLLPSPAPTPPAETSTLQSLQLQVILLQQQVVALLQQVLQLLQIRM